MKLRAATDIDATPRTVWAFVDDPYAYLHFMTGITRFEVAGKRDRGLGARYILLMRVGSAEMGGLVEVVEHREQRDLAWTSVYGIDQRARWRLRERRHADGEISTRVELRLDYGIAGAGLSGKLAERIGAPMVSRNLSRSLQQLKRLAEHEQLRERAAERRASRAS
jgi:uncharacterized membrane protein